MTVDEYYQYIFERVPGLPETAEKEGLTPLDYMRRFGAFEMEKEVLELHNTVLSETQLSGSSVDEKSGIVTKDGTAIGIMIEGKARTGFDSPSRKQEFFSQTMVDWKWPEHRLPGYIKSHIHAEKMESEIGRAHV